MPLQNTVVAVINGTLFYLTAEGYASDRPERARMFRDLTDAALEAVKQNRDRTWGELRGLWTPANRVGGVVVSPVGGAQRIDRHAAPNPPHYVDQETVGTEQPVRLSFQIRCF